MDEDEKPAEDPKPKVTLAELEASGIDLMRFLREEHEDMLRE